MNECQQEKQIEKQVLSELRIKAVVFLVLCDIFFPLYFIRDEGVCFDFALTSGQGRNSKFTLQSREALQN